MDSKDTTNNGQNPVPVTPAVQKPEVAGERGLVKKEGKVIEALPNAFFKVVLEDGKEVMGFLSGKMRLNRIKILPGDKVTLEMSEYDMSKARIVYRLK
ncbi:MAG: translation initiation factor IF-1 [Candidatus Paceibacterales bacterium]